MVQRSFATVENHSDAKNSMNMEIRAFDPLRALSLLFLVAACGSSEPQINPTTRLSTDPVLTSVIASFKTACIGNAPAFQEAVVKAAFSSNQPYLAPGMDFIASGEPGRKCRVTVKGYGRDRPMPTVGDVNRLGQSLAARLGGTLIPKSADTGAGSAKIKANRKTYHVFGYVDPDGNLNLSVF